MTPEQEEACRTRNEINKYLTEKLFKKTWVDMDITRTFNPDFFTLDGFISLWRKCKKQKWWADFPDNDRISPDTFASRVQEFIRERKGED